MNHRCTREYDFNEPNIDMLYVSECSGSPRTRKPVLLSLDDRSEVVNFCHLFAPLRVVLLVSACFVLWAERLTHRPQLEIDNRRHPRNPQTGLSQCFSSVLMCSETAVISVCRKRVPKVCREAFVTIEMSLGRLIGRPGSPVKKASTNVRGAQATIPASVVLSYVFAPIGLLVNSDPSLCWVFLCLVRRVVVGVTVGVLCWSCPPLEADDSSLDMTEALFAMPAVYAVTEETSPRVHICPAQEDEKLINYTSISCYSAVVAVV
ncbi:hypothetical protein CRG98_010633 [Punica granatum]|uniref:Uncharacterized protein n=1 Tax=Punica granatum TaxID=22663 RepID=A0A2I0KL61_PUNGR|nr:hypothetical protein CRG98_010633 [Punica granatum]